MEISRRKFLTIGGLSALALSLFSSLPKVWGKSLTAFSSSSSESEYQPEWLQGSPHLGCSYPYFKRIEPPVENRWLEMLHFHLKPNLREAIIYDMPFKG